MNKKLMRQAGSALVAFLFLPAVSFAQGKLVAGSARQLAERTAPEMADVMIPATLEIPARLTQSNILGKIVSNPVISPVTYGASLGVNKYMEAVAPIIPSASVGVKALPSKPYAPSVSSLKREIAALSPVAAADALFQKKEKSPEKIFEVYFIDLPNLFFQPFDKPFAMRQEQVEEADKFYKQFLKGRNIYGNFNGSLSKFYLPTLTDSHIKWAEVLYAFTGLSLLGQPGAGDAIVDASLRAPSKRQAFTDYIATHALLLLEDWPALQRLINLRSAAGYGSFVELREYLAKVVPDAPIFFPKKIINEELRPFHRVYHYPTFREQLQLMDTYVDKFIAEGLERFADYMRGEKYVNYFLLSEYPLSSFVTGKRRKFELSEVARDYKRGKVFVEANLKYGGFTGLMDNFETYGVQEEDIIEKNENAFFKCISYEASITDNMACIRSKVHRPIIYTPEQQ